MTKITKKDTLNAIITAIEDGTATFSIDADVVKTFCLKEIDALDKKATKAKEKAAEKRAQGDELSAAVEAVLTADPQSIADITAQIDGDEITVGKVGYRLRVLAENGKAVKSEIKIAATETSKARSVVGYSLPVED